MDSAVVGQLLHGESKVSYIESESRTHQAVVMRKNCGGVYLSLERAQLCSERVLRVRVQ